MSMRNNYLACGLLLAAVLSTARAGEEDDILFNQVFLQASAQRQVENDRLEVTLAAESQGKSPAQIAGEVNEIMTWAVDKANAVEGMEVSTGSYHTYPIYRDQTVIAWRAGQQLLLKSADIAGLSEMVGDLQQRLQVKQMQFTVSPDARRDAENALIEEAVEAFKKRVGTVQKHMEGKDYRIVSLHINTGGPAPVMFQERAMAMDAKANYSPAVEAGSSDITVTVSGSVQFF